MRNRSACAKDTCTLGQPWPGCDLASPGFFDYLCGMLDTDTEIPGLKEAWRAQLLEAGAAAVGFARAVPVDDEAWSRFGAWMARGGHGSLAYMGNHPALRRDPRGLLEGARTLISVAWPYLPQRLRDPSLPFIARYAYAPDYHKSIRKILKPILSEWQRELGVRSRVCVDSAPVLERWWAVRAGVGFTGRNGCLIVPGHGSWVFLSEILVTAVMEADTPCDMSCLDCGRCVSACPTGALGRDGTVDCRRCLSALTVECPGEATGAHATLAGCDRCQEACPHNRMVPPSAIPHLAPMTEILELSAEDIRTMTADDFRARFGASALSRMGLEGLRANLDAMGAG